MHRTSLLAVPVLLALSTAATASAANSPTSAGAHEPTTITVAIDNETPVLYDDEDGGNTSGDDPAIWVHPSRSDRSIVVVTAKEGGLRVYDLADRELQSLPSTVAPQGDAIAGRYNNVDIAYGLRVRGHRVDVAVVSDRYNDTLRFFAIDPGGAAASTPLSEITAPGQDYLFQPDREGVDTEQTAYGLAVYQPGHGSAYAVVTQEGTTTIATARLVVRGGAIGYAGVRQLDLPGEFPLPDGTTWAPCEEPGVEPQLEGLSVDQATGEIYAAQEDVGLWRIGLPLGAHRPVLVDRTTDFGVHDAYDPETEECVPIDPADEGFGGDWLTADAEGVDLYYGPRKTGYVIVSSQGDDSFVVYQRKHDGRWARNEVMGAFQVAGAAGSGVDEINGSDGVAVTNRPVGRFRWGLLVSHDEPETGPSVDPGRDATNFSYVSWRDIAAGLHLVVDTRAGNDPRFD
ncbi:MAG TPA: phytase [Nocardioides sp.]|uniref:phytase n=1 Tax=uncultured Nocardioides sp. TaxID=198441 RepID=UPI0026017836|nr:phytase [uncultured Nocardioides sp.]HRD62288.1 phytase [Nocardioides sp.]HRI95429.1 phytase [Nocardioides sp.]HRK45309.1 phytase [Nocardioides sp.]